MIDIDKEVITLILIFFAVFILPIAFLGYYSSCKQAEIINGRYDTNYTCSDLFWAKDAINKGRYNINLE